MSGSGMGDGLMRQYALAVEQDRVAGWFHDRVLPSARRPMRREMADAGQTVERVAGVEGLGG